MAEEVPPQLGDLATELLLHVTSFLVPRAGDADPPRPWLYIGQKVATGRYAALLTLATASRFFFRIVVPVLYKHATPMLTNERMGRLLGGVASGRTEYLTAVRSAKLLLPAYLRPMGTQEYENLVVVERVAERQTRREWLRAFGPSLEELELMYQTASSAAEGETGYDFPESVRELLTRVEGSCRALKKLNLSGFGLHAHDGGDALLYFGGLEKDPLLALADLTIGPRGERGGGWAELAELGISLCRLPDFPHPIDAGMLSPRAPNLRRLSLTMAHASDAQHAALAFLFGRRIPSLSLSYAEFQLRETSASSRLWFSGFPALVSLTVDNIILSPRQAADLSPLLLRAREIELRVDGNPSIRFGRHSVTIRDPEGVLGTLCDAAADKLREGETGRTEVRIAVRDVDWFEMPEAEGMWRAALTGAAAARMGCAVFDPDSEPGEGRHGRQGIEVRLELKEKTAPGRAAALMVEREAGFVVRDRGRGKVVRMGLRMGLQWGEGS
ncbi:hypothetical protein DFJ74DRAFT_25981 [Hyaloraphidium curvatum]|nr:hypothetical protein DFJ74DRAFT_25981 [Hyaloraphidium curvatum]